MKWTTLVETVAYWAQHTPDNVCLIDANDDRKITYGEFWRHIRMFARCLREMGLQKGDRVVVRVGSLIETFVAQFGIYLAGGVYCPVEKHMKELKLLEILEYFDATLLVSNERVARSGQWFDLSGVCDDGDQLEAFAFPGLEDCCAILFTTGTTGKAKGVMLRHETNMNFAEIWGDAYELTPDDVYLWIAPLDRVASIRVFGPAFIAGAQAVHFSGSVFVNDFFNIFDAYHVSAMLLDPSTLSLALNTAPDSFSKYAGQMHVIGLTGSETPEKYQLQLKELFPATRLLIQYGATEASPIAKYEFSRHAGNAHCLGKPVAQITVSFVDAEGNTMSATADNPGIIVVEGKKNIMNGYWKDPELTAKVLRNGRLITTDMGYMDEEGFLYSLGRKDDVIVSGGHKIAPYEIEDVVMQLPGILECACVPAQNKVLGSVPKLFVIMKRGAEFSVKEIAHYLAQRLETFKLPRMIQQLDSLPRTIGGQKIDRKALEKL